LEKSMQGRERKGRVSYFFLRLVKKVVQEKTPRGSIIQLDDWLILQRAQKNVVKVSHQAVKKRSKEK